MNRDLEESLDELGPACRAVVARLKGAATAEDGRRGSKNLPWPLLVAASLLTAIGLGVWFRPVHVMTPASENAPFGAHEYRASVGEMIATQNPDGSWTNDFLTRRNAAALRASDDPAAAIAYKKALRYLTSRGLAPQKS